MHLTRDRCTRVRASQDSVVLLCHKCRLCASPKAVHGTVLFARGRKRTPSDAHALNNLVVRINQTLAQEALVAALKIGGMVIKAVLHGDPNRISARPPASMSYRKLTSHPDLAMSHSRLWQMVRVTRQYNTLPPVAQTLSFTHQRALLQAPSDAVRTELAVQAATTGWSTRELERRISQLRAPRGCGGRPPLATLVRALRDLLEIRNALGGRIDHEILFRGLNAGETVETVREFEEALKVLGKDFREIRLRALARCNK